MAPLKALKVDGFQAKFLQSQWDIIGPSIYSLVRQTLWGLLLNPNLNKTLLVPNFERVRRHMTRDGDCPRCSSVLETEVNAIRDCAFSRVVWLIVILRRVSDFFFSLPFNEWYLWKELCKNCVQAIVDTGYAWPRSYTETNMKLDHPRSMRSLLNLSHPGKDWIKLNTDGAISYNVLHASIGGVFRDSNVEWLCGHLMSLGRESIFKVEGKVMLGKKGLRRLWWNVIMLGW
ncbi:hypothetical protein J1N35_001241 [Gossypium stocksii]|uniref:Reverse transcriptase zinc-binding domain-containing protein n=1 Tax=Gossypium stocksii TaxID=47602 RepID=A0A9D3WJM7_9ROSI|nr:hypothetical protein J1N35_001241 [Gossypium stocksii]